MKLIYCQSERHTFIRTSFIIFCAEAPRVSLSFDYCAIANSKMPKQFWNNSIQLKGTSHSTKTGCPIEKTKTEQYSRILSLTAWRQKETLHPEQVTFHLRGKGVISIALFLMLATPG